MKQSVSTFSMKRADVFLFREGEFSTREGEKSFCEGIFIRLS